MGTRKNKSNKRFRKTRSKRQRGGTLNQELLNESENAPPNDDAVEVIQELLDNGADVNARDSNNDNNTPLIHATDNILDGEDDISCDIVRLLLKYGADVNAKNRYGKTALYVSGSEKLDKILIQNGATIPDKQDKKQKLTDEERDRLEKIKEEVDREKEREKDHGNLAVIRAATQQGKTDASWKVKDVMGLLTEGQAPYAKNIKSFLGGKRKTKKSRKSKRKTRKTRRK